MIPKRFFQLFILILCICSMVATVTAADKSENAASARTMFDKGEQLFEAGEYMEAAAAFQRAYDFSPHPAALVNIGYCYEYANEPVKAIAVYQTYLSLAGEKESDTVTDVQNRLAMLKLLVGEVHVFCKPVNCSVEIDGVQKGTTTEGTLVVRLTPGSYTVAVRGEDGQTASSEYRVEAGEVTNARFTFEKKNSSKPPLVQRNPALLSSNADLPADNTPPQDSGARTNSRVSPLKLTFWTLCAGALGSGIATSFYGAKTLKANTQYKDSEYLDANAHDDAVHNRKMTNIFIGVTAALVVGAVTVKLIDIRKSRKHKRSHTVALETEDTIGLGGRF